MIPLSSSVINAITCEGTPYNFNGQVLTVTGEYRDTLTSAAGCDSVVTLRLTVNPAKTRNINQQICTGQLYFFDGRNLGVSGTYVDTLKTGQGCDSIVTLNLTVLDVLTSELNITLCKGLTYPFGGQILSQAGTYLDTLISNNGCDSVITLHLNYNDVLLTQLNETICQGEVYNFNGDRITVSGVYRDTLRTLQGCDSIVTLQLNVFPVKMTDVPVSICQGDTYLFAGRPLTVAGTYRDTLSTSAGCDSIIVLHLTVRPILSGTINAAICSNETYLFNGQPLSRSGTYTDTLTGSNGCDSILTLQLIVHPLDTIRVEQEVCSGSTYNFFGQSLTTGGIYQHVLVNRFGCDSLVILDLTVNDSYNTNLTASICSGQTYRFDGRDLRVSGTYTMALVSAQGCDSTVTLTFTVDDALRTTVNETICEGGSYSFFGRIITTPGTFVDTVSSVAGCDSIVTLHLSINPRTTAQLTADICPGTTYTFLGKSLSLGGTYVDTIPNVNGCDSIVTLTLNIIQVDTTYQTAEICTGESFDFNGRVLTAAGDYEHQFTSNGGCTSLIKLTLIVHPVYTEDRSVQICSGETFDFYGRNLSTAGAYSHTLQTEQGCDSTINLTLMVVDQIKANLSETICTGQSYRFDGRDLTTSGTYTQTLTSAQGCDSIVTLILTVDDVLRTTVNETICEGETFSFFSQNLAAGGTYVDTISTSAGCDSIVTLQLTVRPRVSSQLSIDICPGNTYSFHGRILQSAGTYVDTIPNIFGCDSIVTLNLQVIQADTTYQTAEICTGESFDFNGRVLTAAGDYEHQFTGNGGCTSLIKLTLIVHPVYTEDRSVQICSGETYDFYGRNLTSTGAYSHTLQTSQGCDSTINLTLTVVDQIRTNLNETICTGQSYRFDGRNLTNSGTYTQTLTSAQGCDSIVTLTLTVDDALRTTITEAICAGETYNFHGQILSVGGTFTDTVSSSTGCDSIVTLILNIKPHTASQIAAEICAGSSYDFLGRPLTVAGTYIDTISNQQGCDSVITLTLKVLPVYSDTLGIEICAGESYDFAGQKLNATGTYDHVFAGANGCDSSVTIQLVVHPLLRTDLTASICEGETHIFGTQTLVRSGVYVQTVTSSLNCDSIITLTLTVHPVYQTTVDQQICTGQTYNFLGKNLNQGGTYVDTLTSLHGCDSVVTLNLKVVDEIIVNVSEQLCAGQTINFAGRVLTTSGVYRDTSASSFGCDSVTILTLEILDKKTEDISATICEGEIYLFNGQNLSTAGQYTFNTKALSGCDSLVTLTLTVLPVKRTSLNGEFCEGGSYNFHNRLLKSSGTFVDTLQGVNGCDSIVTLNLVEKKTVSSAMTVDICPTDRYWFVDKFITQQGEYQDTLVSQQGCDSIITLTLRHLPLHRTTQFAQVCKGDYYLIQGDSLSKSGIYTYTVVSSLGCDSVITLNLAVADVLVEERKISICKGESYSFGRSEITEAGFYSDTLQSSGGCDSIIYLTVEVLEIKPSNVTAKICEGETYRIGQDIFKTTGTYQSVLKGANGCDSIVNLTLTVVPPVTTQLAVSICDAASYSFHGKPLNQAGTYRDTLTGATGCDSIVVLQLSIQSKIALVETKSICEGESITINGKVYTQSGQFEVTYAAASGCDSVVAYTIAVDANPKLIVEDMEICPGETVQLKLKNSVASGLTWSSDGPNLTCTNCESPQTTPQKTSTFTVSAVGCNGKIIQAKLDVKVVPYPELEEPQDYVLKYNESANVKINTKNPAVVTIYDDKGNVVCENCKEITLSPKQTTNYVVRAVNSLGCEEEADFLISIDDGCQIGLIEISNALTPNNDGFNDFWEIKNTGEAEITEISVYTRWGERVFLSGSTDDKWNGTHKNVPVNQGVYVYMVRGICIDQTPFVLRGNITVIR